LIGAKGISHENTKHENGCVDSRRDRQPGIATRPAVPYAGVYGGRLQQSRDGGRDEKVADVDLTGFCAN
jgi:hypothetical protein